MAGTENTGHGPTLDAAAQQITGLLSIPEDRKAAETQPEQVPATEPTQAPAAPTTEASAEESEQATTEDAAAADAPPPQPRTIKVKVDGEEFEVTEEEAAKGYSRTEVFTRKSQALAEEKAKWERETREVERAALAQWVESAKQLEAMVAPTEPDWKKLSEELPPDAFQREFMQWQEQAARRKEVATARQQVEERQRTLEAESTTAMIAEERASLARELPDFADPVKAKALGTELMEYGLSRGFTPAQLTIHDHRLVLLLHDAMQGHKARTKAPEIKNKIENALSTATPGADTPAPKKSQLTAAKQRLRDSGRTEDAAAAIAHLL